MTIADRRPNAADADIDASTSPWPVHTEPNHRRLRVLVGGQVIADTIASVYVFEVDHLPVYYFPKSDVRWEYLEHTEHTTHCPRKGDAEYWSIVVGDRRIENAVWSYPVPIDGAPDLSQYVAFYWHRVDHWFEEDEEVFVHARDPYKRVEALRSSRHVEVRIDGQLVADTVKPVLLFETGLPTRYYIPMIDICLDLFHASDTVTACPYKGTARYMSLRGGGDGGKDIAWVYPTPIPQIPTIENHVAFFNERVDISVDGQLQERPTTKWSTKR